MDIVPNLGCIVDLSQTKKSRYIVPHHIHRQQIPMIGAGHRPKIQQLDTVCKYIATYRRLHPDKLVAVHCLHGLNRTFCVIMWWLCVHHNYDFTTAYNIFVQDRSAPTRRQLVNHMRTLIQSYLTSHEVVPPTLVLPFPPTPPPSHPNLTTHASVTTGMYHHEIVAMSTCTDTLPLPFARPVGSTD